MDSWIIFSLLGAFFQSIEVCSQKYLLNTKEYNNVIAFFVFTIAGILFGIIYFSLYGFIVYFNYLFWSSIIIIVLLNFVAIYFLFKIMNEEDISYLMPHMSFSLLFTAMISIFLLNEIPSIISIVGICFITAGAIYMDKAKKAKKQIGLKIKIMFFTVLLCYALCPPFFKIAIVNSNVLFVTFISHLFIGLSFFLFLFIIKEQHIIKHVLSFDKLKYVGSAVMAIALSNLSINYALSLTNVVNVIAIKRTSPVFVLIIGFFFLREKNFLGRKIISTVLMTIGSILLCVK